MRHAGDPATSGPTRTQRLARADRVNLGGLSRPRTHALPQRGESTPLGPSKDQVNLPKEEESSHVLSAGAVGLPCGDRPDRMPSCHAGAGAQLRAAAPALEGVRYLSQTQVMASTVEQVLVELGEKRATGCLTVTDPAGEQAEVYFKDGSIYSVFVPGRRAQLGARLIASGDLSPEALASALDVQTNELQGWRLGELLVHLGYVERCGGRGVRHRAAA